MRGRGKGEVILGTLKGREKGVRHKRISLGNAGKQSITQISALSHSRSEEEKRQIDS